MHPGQLHHNAIQPLLLDHRLGHTQFVDAVVQGRNVLLEGLFLHGARSHGLDGRHHLDIGAVGCFQRIQIGKLVLDDALGGLGRRRIAEADFNGLPVAGDTAVAHILLAQSAANVT